MSVVMVTANGEEHGLVNTLANSCQDNDFKHMDEKTKAEAKRLKKEDSRTVKARYINHRGMHERLDKPYCRYAGDPIRVYHLIPGYEYDLPYGMIREVNESKGLAERSKQDDDKTPVNKVTSYTKIHELVPCAF
jgi:hypothetical protein